ncbi:hypothetical protein CAUPRSCDRAFT_11556 [Caulochytrium protostelioides]|nr:hypothetical protein CAUPRSCDRAFT_11556 [Caulochytrium protostelioides]
MNAFRLMQQQTPLPPMDAAGGSDEDSDEREARRLVAQTRQQILALVTDPGGPGHDLEPLSIAGPRASHVSQMPRTPLDAFMQDRSMESDDSDDLPEESLRTAEVDARFRAEADRDAYEDGHLEYELEAIDEVDEDALDDDVPLSRSIRSARHGSTTLTRAMAMGMANAARAPTPPSPVVAPCKHDHEKHRAEMAQMADRLTQLELALAHKHAMMTEQLATQQAEHATAIAQERERSHKLLERIAALEVREQVAEARIESLQHGAMRSADRWDSRWEGLMNMMSDGSMVAQTLEADVMLSPSSMPSKPALAVKAMPSPPMATPAPPPTPAKTRAPPLPSPHTKTTPVAPPTPPSRAEAIRESDRSVGAGSPAMAASAAPSPRASPRQSPSMHGFRPPPPSVQRAQAPDPIKAESAAPPPLLPLHHLDKEMEREHRLMMGEEVSPLESEEGVAAKSQPMGWAQRARALAMGAGSGEKSSSGWW